MTTGEAAGIVIGQPGYTTNTVGSGASGLHTPTQAIFDSHGNLWVADQSNNRVLEYVPGSSGCPAGQFCDGMSASLEIGQSSCAYNTAAGPSPPTASSLTHPHWLAFDSSGNLWVADYGNNRVLEYLKGSGFTCSESASFVIGESNFVTNSHSPFSGASGLAFDASGDLWVADQNNALVYEYQFAASGTATGSQTGSTLQDTTKTWTANQWHNFVVTITSGTGAGQSRTVSSNTVNTLTVSSAWVTTPDSTSHYSIGSPPNGQNIALTLGGSGTSLYCCPVNLAFDSSGNLWVAVFSNSEVVEYTTPFSSGESFTTALGQSSLSGTACTTTRTGDCWADGVTFDSSGNLWVTEYGNNRIVEYGVVPPATPGVAVTCSPSNTVDVGSSSTCTATLTGESGSITGEAITWSQTGGTGGVSFSLASCDLSGSPESCSVTATGSTVGSATIQASYPGDANNLASSNTAALTVDPALLVSAPSGTPPTVDQGQTSSLSAAFSGGTSPYTCQWLMEAPGAGSFSALGGASSCSSPASASFVTTGSTTAGTWLFELQVTDGASNTVTSSSGSVAVNTALEAGPTTPSSPVIQSGASVTLTANPSGGTGSYSYQWYTSSDCSTSPVSGATSSTYDTGALTFDNTYYYKVTDSAHSPGSACSPGDTVTVVPPLPGTAGGVFVPVGASYTDAFGNTWLAPGGTIYGVPYTSYFFAGPQSEVPPPMLQGWGGVYGTYDGQQGWIVSFY